MKRYISSLLAVLYHGALIIDILYWSALQHMEVSR